MIPMVGGQHEAKNVVNAFTFDAPKGILQTDQYNVCTHNVGCAVTILCWCEIYDLW